MVLRKVSSLELSR